MNDIIGHGGGKGGGSSHTHYEAPDSLHSTAYARVLDLVSEGEILGLAEGTQSVYLNNTPVTNSDGSSNFKNVSIDFRVGTQDQDYIAGFPDVESEVTVGLELKYGTPWVHAIGNTALSAIRITLGVDQMYKTDTDNGDVGGTSVSYSIELSTDGGTYKAVLSNSFSGKTMSAYQRTARIDLPPATSGWQIRVTRLTPNSTLASIADKTRIISYTEVIDAKLRYPMSAIVGIQLDATQFQAVPTRAYDLFGRIIQVPSNYDAKTRTYTGTWDGTFKPSWTDNPAWVFRDLALHDRYGLGNRITASQVDKWALYKIARYCDEMVPNGKGGTEPRFTCNLYLQSRKQAYAVLQDIASVFRGISYWGAGSIIASADMPSDPVYIYTAANVIGGKFTRTGTKKSTRYTVALVMWNDPDDFFKQKVEYVEDREGIARYGIQQIELTAFGCTSQGQAQRAGRWALTTSRLETEGITFDVGMDGAIALPGQVVRIADPSRMGRRVGGRVRAAAGRTVTLDKAPVINVGDQLTVVLPTGVSETHVVAAVSGDSVTINADWTTVPVAQSVWSIDSNELMAPLYRVLSVTEKDEVTFTIAAVQHEPGKYDFVENGTAITPRNQTSLDVTKQAPPASVTLTGYTVSLNDVQKLALQVSCAPVAGAVAYEGAYRRGNDNWIAIPRQPSPTMDVLDVLPGTYMAKMAAVNSIGVTSVETQSVAVEIARDGVSKNADVLLTSDVAYFHTDTNGVTDPSTITFTASLIALDGPVTWSCVGGTLTNKAATTAQLAFADATAASITVTASVTAFGRTYSRSLTVRKVQDGASGSDGLQTDVARLYQWAPVKPAKPTGTSTFNWTGLTNTGYTANDGWANPAPDNPGNPGWRLYVASVGVSAAIAATTSPVSYTNAVIEAWSQNGANGASGAQSRVATVYQWAVSLPAGPTGPATFKWSDGTFGAAPTNWTLTPGNPPSLGMTLFAATVQVVDSAASATTAFNWQSAAVMAIGYVGTNGGPGAQGASYVTAYIASSALAASGAPAPTTGKNSLPAANSSGLAGAWSSTVPTLADGQRQYQTDGIYDPTTDKVTWSIPYWSSLKVATLSAITANLGAINAGSINLGNGTFTVDNDGNLVCRSIKIVDPATGETVLQAGGKLNPKYAAPGTLNSDLTSSISNAQQAADAANAAIANISSDNVLSKGEKPAAQQAWSVIYNERAGLQSQAGALGVDSGAYRAKFDALETYLSGLGTAFNDNTTDTLIVGSTFNTRFSDYYLAKTALTNAMAAANKAFADSAKATADAAITAINNISSDSVLSKGEKPAANQAWGVIYNERAGLQNQASALGVDSSAYAAKFTALQNYLVSLGSGFTDYSTDTLIDGGVFSVRFSDYYLAKQALLNAMTAANAATAAAANSAIADPVNGLAQKLKANAQNILAGGAGLSAGSLTWDSDGNRTGGYGLAVNRLGIVGYNSSGSVTFNLSAATGDVGIAGTVYALAGSIGGMTLSNSALCSGAFTDYAWPSALEADGITYKVGCYFGPTGILIGNGRNNRYFQVTNSGDIYAPGFKLEGSQLTLTSSIILNPNISGASFDSFAASLSGSAGGSFANTSSNVGYGTLTASPSGGRAPYTYQWTLTESSRTNTAYRMNVSGSTTGQSLALVGFGSNCTNEYRVTCIVTDANGRTATIGRSVTANHGTPP